MSWMLFSIFLATLLVIKGRYRKTDSCPSGIVQWRIREGVFQCPPETPYHCILMYNSSQLYETCIAAVTIGPGKEGCPWILFHQDIPIHGSRNSECPVTNPDCPPINHKGYLSNQLYQYPACFFESSKRTNQLKPSTVAENNVEETPLMPIERNVIVWIIVPIITIVLIVLVVIVLLRRKKVICSTDQGSGRTKIDGQEPESNDDCETENFLDDPENGLSNGPLEDVVRVNDQASPDHSKSGNQLSQVQGPGKRQEPESNDDCETKNTQNDQENGLSNGPLKDVVRVYDEAAPDNSKSGNKQSQMRVPGKRQEPKSIDDCETENIIDDPENGLLNGPFEDVVRVNDQAAPDNSKSKNQQSQVQGPGKRDEEPDIIGKNEDLTSTDDKNVTDTQREEVYNENLAHRVFQDILDTSDGVVSYQDLLMHFIQKKDCSKLALNLENIIETNGHMFRYLADQNICFVIAYSPKAVICDNYNPLSLAGECVDPNCSKFHICTFYVKGLCKNPHCTLSHTYGDEHNIKVKERLRLGNYTDNDISKILLNRYPKICFTSGCDMGVNCPYLHICSKFSFGKCSHGLKCRFGHSFSTEHNTWILKAYGISEGDIWSGSSIARKLTFGKRI